MKPQAEALKQKFLFLLNKPVHVTFGPHAFTCTITGIEQARLADLINKPERRIDSEGKFYTPTVLTLHCGEERMHFYVEDVQHVIPSLSGSVVCMVNGERITFSWA